MNTARLRPLLGCSLNEKMMRSIEIAIKIK
jgi:hypothetical protein